MWPFRSTPAVTLTAEAFARWLRAQRPELKWFLALPEDEQETLATIGEQYISDVAVAVSYAIKDPQVAELGARMAAGDDAAELSLLQMVAKQSGPTFGGISARKTARAAATQATKNTGRSLFGRAPDPVAT